MTSKERIRAILRQRPHDRLGWDFLSPSHQDILPVPSPILTRPGAEAYRTWGKYPELLRKVPGFRGEVSMDPFGNILGRLDGKTKGECVRGALEDGWETLEHYRFPEFDREGCTALLKSGKYSGNEKYILAGLPTSVFSVLRDIRRIANALMDTIEEPEYVTEFLTRLHALTLPMLDTLREVGVDGVMICDDWGTQTAPFLSPRSFGELFAPAYAKLADACHERGLDLIVHSCGCVYPLVGMMTDAGVNCFQFDQPELTGSGVWAEEYGSRAAFYCPVDIQKVLPTGDRALIEKTAKRMCGLFRAHGGNLIAKDYPSYGDINVDPMWAEWAMNVIIANSDM